METNRAKNLSIVTQKVLDLKPLPNWEEYLKEKIQDCQKQNSLLSIKLQKYSEENKNIDDSMSETLNKTSIKEKMLSTETEKIRELLKNNEKLKIFNSIGKEVDKEIIEYNTKIESQKRENKKLRKQSILQSFLKMFKKIGFNK